MAWAELVDEYLGELRARGLSHHTLRGYRADLLRLSLDLPVDPADVRNALDGLAPATRARRASALRGWWTWARTAGQVTGELDLEPGPRPPSDRARAPESTAVRAVLDAIPRQADRDQLLFRLLATLGLRPGEALALRAEDVDTEAATLDVTGWGGRRRQVLIDDRTLNIRLHNWLWSTGIESGPLFRSPTGEGALRYQSVAQRWARYTTAAGVTLSLGDLRRAHSAELLAGGVPEWVVRDRIGQSTGDLPGARAGDAAAAITAWSAATRKAG
ncbi:MAG TPA: tyrosine-type recombinase/integrase [Pseudonocardiaceae bacterium]|jgi:integrase